MKFIDLGTQQKRIRDRIESRLTDVLNHGQYIMGPEITVLESTLADFVGVEYAVACSSGTDALIMALMAFDVGPGDAILTTPFTFVATAEVISLLGATPVFVDIEPNTFNIDPKKLAETIDFFKSNNTSRKPMPNDFESLTPKGLIAVDLFGLPADYDRINEIAASNGLFVIEDAAQSFGASYYDKRACGLADIACTSFFPAKPLGAYGDGGMCFLSDARLHERLKSVRVHGQGKDKYENIRIGINGRLDTLQAAILLEKFSIFHEEIEMRGAAAERYAAFLRQSPAITLPVVPEGYKSIWAQYSIMAETKQVRAAILEALRQNGIPSAIYYPIPLHLQKAFENLGYQAEDFPVSEDAAERIFSIPMHPYLEADDQKRIAEIILNI